MEGILLYFISGLALFAVTAFLRRHPVTIRLPAQLITGSAGLILISLVSGFPLAGIHLPIWIPAAAGAVAGLLIHLIDRGNWVGRPGLSYLSTLVPGSLLSGFIFLCIRIATLSGTGESVFLFSPVQLILLSALAGFSTIFGFTFPFRWFRLHVTEGIKKSGGDSRFHWM